MIPRTVQDVDESHAVLDQSPGQQTVAGERQHRVTVLARDHGVGTVLTVQHLEEGFKVTMQKSDALLFWAR